MEKTKIKKINNLEYEVEEKRETTIEKKIVNIPELERTINHLENQKADLELLISRKKELLKAIKATK